MKMRDASKARKFQVLGGVRALFLLIVGLTLSFIIPSSGRASDFVKIGSPVSSTTELYGIASVYDRNPKQFEAWAVGKTVSDNKGVMVYFNGNFWTRVSLPSIEPLRSVTALRYLRGTEWTTAAWAVGDKGTILRLDPSTKSWKVQKKYITSTLRCGSPSGNSCTTAGTSCTDPGGVAQTCVDVSGRSCTDVDVNAGSAACGNWTSNDLKTVAAYSSSSALAAGERTGADPKILLRHIYSTMGGYETTSWDEIGSTPTPFTTNDDIYSINFVDSEHGWMVGYDRVALRGRLWKFTAKAGWQSVTLSAANSNNLKFTSVASLLRKTATTTDAPLTSVVWVGAEKTGGTAANKIIRFDENGSVETATTTTSPVRSLALGRKSSGQSEELLTNGNFSADRQDSNATYSKRYADGWKGANSYLSGRTPDTYLGSTVLINGESGQGRAFAAEPWQGRTTATLITGSNKNTIHAGIFGENPAAYPYDSLFSSGGALSFTSNETDVTSKLVSAAGTASFPGLANPYQFGADLSGYVKIPNNTGTTTATIRVAHPNGRATFFIENDTNDLRCELNGVPTGQLCPSGSGCTGGAVCVDHSAYPSSTIVPSQTSASLAWGTGICSNKSASIPQDTACFDSSECTWGYCSNDPTKRCRNDVNTFNGCTGGTCIPWTVSSNSCTASPISSAPTDTTISFPANKGILVRACTNAADAGKPCLTDEQCSSVANSCQVQGGGWYPFILKYYQVNSARCSNFPQMPCTSNFECDDVGATCVTGKWCATGAKRGNTCALDSDCGGIAGSCVNQYQGTCSQTPAQSCISSYDCPRIGNQYDTCNLVSNPPSPLTLSWNCDATGCGGARPFVAIPSTNVMTNVTNTNRQSILQEIPLSTVPGVTYQITGRYKVDFNHAYDNLATTDPRRALVSRAGIRTKCKDTSGTNDSCGYDNTIYTTNLASGVTAGTCSGDSFTCKTDLDCSTGGHGTTCNANWTNFSTTVTKQNRDSTGKRSTDDRVSNYAGQSLEVECFAESGAVIYCDNISVTPVSESAVTKYDTVDVWAVGDAGLVMRNTFNFDNGTPAGSLPNETTNWVTQNQVVTTNLWSITGSDIFHLWMVGDHGAGENVTLYRLSPGNIAGWAWIGSASSTSGIDPVGWVDFNCANSGSCLAQPSAFGVNVDTSPSSPTYGQFSGSAWMSSVDPNETIDFGTCQNKPSGRCVANTAVACSVDNDCVVASAGTTCKLTTSCSSTGTCSGISSRQCSNDGQCYGTCSKNQGFRCTSDADCQVKCSDNPTACHTTGWLSFDRGLVGTPPQAPYNTSVGYTAKFDVATDIVDGWARFQFGKCTNSTTPSASSNLSCFTSSSCPGGETCDWSAAPSQLGSSQAGWVKLRGDSVAPPLPGNGATLQCVDCSAGTNASNGTCKICNGKMGAIPELASCNVCAGCILKRCTSSFDACSQDSDCGATGGTCKAFGICAGSQGDVCFNDSQCSGTSGSCLFGAQCNSCSTCHSYGVSIDYGVTKNFSGYGYSPDLGWIDFGRVTLGGQLFFQTQFGDIYSGGNIGGPLTGVAPGFPGNSSRCNATYRIVSAGTISNFCSFAQPNLPDGSSTDPLQSPFISPNSDRFVIPSLENNYTTKLGKLDREGLVNVVSTVNSIKRNKYADVVSEYAGDTNISTIFGCAASGSCTGKLLGRVYHITGNLTIDRDVTFNPGTGSESGAGTFVVDGALIVSGNIQYFTPTGSGFSNDRKSLPSVGFIIRGNTDIDQSVQVMVGAYYSEGTILTALGENPLTVSGLMIAKNFDFRRRFRGLGTGSQEASELVIYDGRLQTNTPPGFVEVSNSLPNVQESTP